MKNLNYFKNQVAEKHGFSSWEQMEEVLKNQGLLQWAISRMHTAAELYAKSLAVDFHDWNEDHQKKIECVLLETDEYVKHFMKISPILNLNNPRY